MEPYIRVEDICKSYSITGTSSQHKVVSVLENLSFRANHGEFLTFFGPNGCGKTTLLNIISGLVLPDKGIVNMGWLAHSRKKIGFIFQNYRDTLLPWKTNLDNIIFPLVLDRMPKREARDKAKILMSQLDIDLPLSSYPYQLSGGQQQLLSIMRALITQPGLLLLDEPFSALDFSTRVGLQQKMLDAWHKTGVTTLFVSHDIDEAVYLADRVIILSKRPSTVAGVVEVNLPRPRRLELFEDARFFTLRNEVLELYQYGTREKVS